MSPWIIEQWLSGKTWDFRLNMPKHKPFWFISPKAKHLTHRQPATARLPARTGSENVAKILRAYSHFNQFFSSGAHNNPTIPVIICWFPEIGVPRVHPYLSRMFMDFLLQNHPFRGTLISGNLHIEILVGGWATPLNNMNVNWDDEIPNINGKIPKMATKPPTRIYRSQRSHPGPSCCR